MKTEVAEKHMSIQNGHVEASKKRKLENVSTRNTNGNKNGSTEIPSVADIVSKRHKVIGRATQIHFPDSPLYISHGSGQYMYDETNREYLDLMNNVAHVGHCHPYVIKAGQDQMALLSTNSRFLHTTILKVADKLTSSLPEKLSVCFFVNSGTEANDLSMRLAKAYTKHKDVVVLDNAYHGHSVAVIDISPYKFNKSGGEGQKDYVHVLPRPDSYCGIHQGDNNDPAIGNAYAVDACRIMDTAVSNGREIGMFIAESMMSCGGQIIFPTGYLKKIYDHVHKLGGICVADEVQVGFGRVGTSSGYWAFEQQGVVPDIVTVGKPFGNGHPVSCVVTTEEIAQAFEDTKIPYFNTFGGNPVSMAIALAVMEVIEIENLQQNAEEVGNYVLQELMKIKEKHPLVGDVRGVGLFVGIELSEDRMSKAPATEKAKAACSKLRYRGILISRDGPGENVLKLKPPMVITKEDMRRFVTQLDEVLTEIEAED